MSKLTGTHINVENQFHTNVENTKAEQFRDPEIIIAILHVLHWKNK